MEAVLVLVRLIAFLSSAALFGTPLFGLYSGVALARLRTVVAGGGAATALAAAAALVVQTGQMAGDPKAGMDPSTLADMMASGGFGPSVIARLTAGIAALALGLALRRGRSLAVLAAALGAVALGALPWSGHGAADDGAAGLVHVTADIVHLLAAGAWLGALLAFLLLGARRPDPPGLTALHGALKGFSGVGSLLVAAIVASGLVNGWFLVGPDHLADLTRTAWGGLLLAKLAIFAAMLGLASLNRYRLTPRLGRVLAGSPDAALAALRRSIALESGLGLAILALVAVIGTQPPPAS